jgi:hypothetical protein
MAKAQRVTRDGSGTYDSAEMDRRLAEERAAAEAAAELAEQREITLEAMMNVFAPQLKEWIDAGNSARSKGSKPRRPMNG